MAGDSSVARADTPAVYSAASQTIEQVLTQQHSDSRTGLSTPEALARLKLYGANTLRVHHASILAVFGRQLRNPILVLLVATVLVSLLFGDVANAIVIAVILALSVGLGSFTEYRAERAAEELHDRVTHHVVAIRDGVSVNINVRDVVPGDILMLALGTVVPADVRLLETMDLECDESILTGESFAVEKGIAPVAPGTELAELTSAALMGTVVHAGSARAVVVATGSETEFGHIATSLGTAQPQTDFQKGLHRFSVFLLWVALCLTAVIFIGNLFLQRPIIESLMFSLAIAIGMTPQLLPAVVSTGLALGSKRLAAAGVLVKRMVSIEDLGDIDVLVTDKTGTLTRGEIAFVKAVSLGQYDPISWGLLSIEMDFQNPLEAMPRLTALDAALVSGVPQAPSLVKNFSQIALKPFDHVRRFSSSLVRKGKSQYLVAKGSPDDIIARCVDVPLRANELLTELYSEGYRVLAVAHTRKPEGHSIEDANEYDLTLLGFLVFTDPPKESARESLAQFANLGVNVKIATGDNAIVAQKVAHDLGLHVGNTLTGNDIDLLTEDQLRESVHNTDIFARVSPVQKARVLRALRAEGNAVGFLGDGVNDALALHDADVGISVDSATDVAKDAADIVLLEKDLAVLARGVVLGRSVFSNTMKYVLMGTSSDFGNMFSAAFGSLILGFLPMLPGQVLLNDMLYDSSQLALPGDRVDPEQLRRPSHWSISTIRRFMLIFGPISSLFDFVTFGLMLLVFHASQAEFQAGWFVESLATETLIVFAIRTRRTPFVKSRPSWGLIISVLSVVAIGCYLPYSPVAGALGFVPLPAPFFLALLGMIVLYLGIVEIAKHFFFRSLASREKRKQQEAPGTPRSHHHAVHRRAARFSSSHVRQSRTRRTIQYKKTPAILRG